VTQVYFSKESRKIFEKLKDKKLKSRIVSAIRVLSNNPYSGKKLQGKLEGSYSVRIWPYRIVYEFTKDKEILITDIRHRKDAYR